MCRFSSLNLSPAILDSVRDDLLKRLDSLPSAQLPVLVRFLFQTTPAKGHPTVVAALRKDLDLTTDQLQSHVQSQSANTMARKTLRAQDYQLLTLEAIYAAMSFDEKIASAFLTAIAGDQDNSAFDVWLLLMAHGITKMRPKVEALVKKKVVSREWNVRLMTKALSKHGQLLKDYFGAVLALAERGVRSQDPNYIRFGCHLYDLMFGVFVHPFERQEVLTNVLSHIGSQNEAECAAGLDVLLDLTQAPEQLKQLWSFVETVLDLLASFSKCNARKAWAVFVALIWKDSRTADSLDEAVYSTLDMVLRKQLGNARHAFRRSGIIGAVTLLSELAVQRAAGSAKDKEVHIQFGKLWAALLQQCQSDAPYMAFALDELAHAFQLKASDGIPSFNALLETLNESLLTLFDSFTLQVDKKSVAAGVKDEVALLHDLNRGVDTPAIIFWNKADLKVTRMFLCLSSPFPRALSSLVSPFSSSLARLLARSPSGLVLRLMCRIVTSCFTFALSFARSRRCTHAPTHLRIWMRFWERRCCCTRLVRWPILRIWRRTCSSVCVSPSFSLSTGRAR
jgi:hypothetical protein